MTVNIHGKEYKTVAERVDEFRNNEQYINWSIITEIISNDNEFVVMRATILDTDQVARATGYAQEKYGSTNINQTSALENCETSAIGRALACLGLAGTEFASADEVVNAINQQADGVQVRGSDRPASEKQRAYIENLYTSAIPDGDLQDYVKNFGYDWETLTSEQASELIGDLT